MSRMSQEKYQEFVLETCANAGPTDAGPYDNRALGALLELQGELGEVTEIFQKATRRRGGVLTDEDISKLHDELGDVYWGLTALVNALGFNLGTIAASNWMKLTARQSDANHTL